MIGLWVSPEGKGWPVRKEHTEDIKRYPKRFGVDPSLVKGATRQELQAISEALIRNGWVRFREFVRDTFVFDVNKASEKMDVIEAILVEINPRPVERVQIRQFDPPKSFTGNVEEVFNRDILSYGR